MLHLLSGLIFFVVILENVSLPLSILFFSERYFIDLFLSSYIIYSQSPFKKYYYSQSLHLSLKELVGNSQSALACNGDKGWL